MKSEIIYRLVKLAAEGETASRRYTPGAFGPTFPTRRPGQDPDSEVIKSNILAPKNDYTAGTYFSQSAAAPIFGVELGSALGGLTAGGPGAWAGAKIGLGAGIATDAVTTIPYALYHSLGSLGAAGSSMYNDWQKSRQLDKQLAPIREQYKKYEQRH